MSLFSFFSCNKNTTNHRTSTQDESTMIVSQIINGETSTFSYADFHDLKNNKSYDRFLTGNLKLATGKVICVDPLVSHLALAQNWKVPTGSYPVYIYIATSGDFDGRVAYAELSINDEIPEYWEYSLIDEAKLNKAEKSLNGMYPVDAGLSCFADHDAFQCYKQHIDTFYKKNPSGNYYNDVLEKYFNENAHIPPSSRGEDWINYTPESCSGNIIMFGTGWGDGFYARYVGFDKNGNVVKLITDFIQLGSEE
ncbi:MAG: DUF4241 domain-containing protein [Bacteroidetes bacterium]|nr:DUF4241 domain-containing protein [Bacteroidota bacterium]